METQARQARGLAPAGRTARPEQGRLAVLLQPCQRGVQVSAGADAELGEDLARVPFDRAGGHKQLGGDLEVGAAVAGQPGDERLSARKPDRSSDLRELGATEGDLTSDPLDAKEFPAVGRSGSR
jgi:hypothetical protein